MAENLRLHRIFADDCREIYSQSTIFMRQRKTDANGNFLSFFINQTFKSKSKIIFSDFIHGAANNNRLVSIHNFAHTHANRKILDPARNRAE